MPTWLFRITYYLIIVLLLTAWGMTVVTSAAGVVAWVALVLFALSLAALFDAIVTGDLS